VDLVAIHNAQPPLLNFTGRSSREHGDRAAPFLRCLRRHREPHSPRSNTPPTQARLPGGARRLVAWRPGLVVRRIHDVPHV